MDRVPFSSLYRKQCEHETFSKKDCSVWTTTNQQHVSRCDRGGGMRSREPNNGGKEQKRRAIKTSGSCSQENDLPKWRQSKPQTPTPFSLLTPILAIYSTPSPPSLLLPAGGESGLTLRQKSIFCRLTDSEGSADGNSEKVLPSLLAAFRGSCSSS